MIKHSDVCPTSATDDYYDCVCVYIEAERERIIALIFDEENLALADLITGWYYGGENKDSSKAIALIKGEQK